MLPSALAARTTSGTIEKANSCSPAKAIPSIATTTVVTATPSTEPAARDSEPTMKMDWLISRPFCLPVRRLTRSQTGVASSAGARNAPMNRAVSPTLPKTYSA